MWRILAAASWRDQAEDTSFALRADVVQASGRADTVSECLPGGVDVATGVEGPAWARRGLDQREGRYPLGVEAPVLAMVATLVPGLSTLTQYARYFTLYWALAGRADRDGLDSEVCRRLVRRSEVLLAMVTDRAHGPEAPKPHGADGVARGLTEGRGLTQLAEVYSPRTWGFWSQYGGPSDALGTVSVEDGALRPGRHECPEPVRDAFAPLIDAAVSGGNEVSASTLDAAREVSLGNLEGRDGRSFVDLFTATRGGVHVAEDWTGTDKTRRSTLRVLLRAGSLLPEAATWQSALERCVAYGPLADEDPVLRVEDRTQGWRGLLLRHHSVGAWRRLWADLVAHVIDNGVTTRRDLHDWACDRVPDLRVDRLLDELAPVMDESGDPAPAEAAVPAELGPVGENVAVLVLGARRLPTMQGLARTAFLGGSTSRRGMFLDPAWVARRVDDHRESPLRDLVRVVVDDMLAQSRRVALRKVQVTNGRLQVFSRLHERNDVYTARHYEGRGNVGLRIDQLAAIALQLGLVENRDGQPLSARGADLLGLPA